STGSKDGEGRVSLGYLESRVVDGRWCFYLHLWGVQEAKVDPLVEELSAAALGALERHIRECLDRQPAETVKPEQLRLSFRLGGGEVRDECRARVKDRYSFPTGDWWRET